MGRWDITAKYNMKKTMIALLLTFCISAVFAQSEQTIGSVYLRIDAGEMYELYENSADSFFSFLAGWKHLGGRDETVTYSYDQLYAKLKAEALRKYGSSYPNLDLKNFDYEMKYTDPGDLPDEKSYTQVIGSSTEYKKKDRIAKYYNCSATVVVKN